MIYSFNNEVISVFLEIENFALINNMPSFFHIDFKSISNMHDSIERMACKQP